MVVVCPVFELFLQKDSAEKLFPRPIQAGGGTLARSPGGGTLARPPGGGPWPNAKVMKSSSLSLKEHLLESVIGLLMVSDRDEHPEEGDVSQAERRGGRAAASPAALGPRWRA